MSGGLKLRVPYQLAQIHLEMVVRMVMVVVVVFASPLAWVSIAKYVFLL